MLEFKNVSVNIKRGLFSGKNTTILENISFTLLRGETLAVFGESGSGKTSIANVILDFIPISKGQVLLNGKDISKQYTRLELSKTVQLISQNPQSSFDPDMPVIKSFEEIMRQHNILNEKGGSFLTKILSDVNMDNINLSRFPNTFSGGELQRLSIARALLIEPDILILDEFDSMLDIDVKIKLYDLIKQIKSAHNLTCIYISHDIRAVFYMSDDVIILEKGRIVEKGCKDILISSDNPFLNEIRTIFSKENFFI